MDRVDQNNRSLRAVIGSAMAVDQAAALQIRALVAIEDGNLSRAKTLFLQAIELHPDCSGAWVNIGNVCLDLRDIAAADAAFQRAWELGDETVACLLGRGLVRMNACRFVEAQALLQRAYQQEPNAADVCLAYAQCLCELESFDQVAACLQGVMVNALRPEQQRVLAWLLAQSGGEEEAVLLYRRLLDTDSAQDELRVQYALLLERLNRLHEAEQVLAGVRVDGIEATSMMHALASARLLRRRGHVRKAVGVLRAVLAAGQGAVADDAMSAQLWFELARCQDLSLNVDAAMGALQRAHAAAAVAFAQRSQGVGLPRVLEWLQQRRHRPVSMQPARDERGSSRPDPVFLVGFPRSGTTLLERVLDGHRGLDVLDERPALEAVIARLRQTPGWRDADMDASLDGLSPAQCSDARQHYWQQVHRYLSSPGRLVDKYPLTLTRLPYVAHLFTHADWLLLLRHPCDCVLSCHMQAFGINGGALAFASLESTAHTYVAVMSMWEQQRLLQPARVHVLRYEELVQDFAVQLAQVMAFLDLPVQEAQLDFASAALARERRINTPSYAQVVQPLNAAAVGRWRRYRAHFSDKTLAMLAPWISRYGYSLD